MAMTAAKILRGLVEFFHNAPLPDICVRCEGDHVVRNGSAIRSASFQVDGEVVYVPGIPCRRVKCQDCRRSWRQRPPGLMPHRHYQLCVVAEGVSHHLFDSAATLEGTARRCQCSRWTVSRWLGWLGRIASSAQLQARLAEVVGAPVLGRVREVAALGRKGADEASRLLLERAAQVLSLLEALGAAIGLEPPGLRSVLLRVIDDRARHTTYASPSIPEFAHFGFGGRLSP